MNAKKPYPVRVFRCATPDCGFWKTTPTCSRDGWCGADRGVRRKWRDLICPKRRDELKGVLVTADTEPDKPMTREDIIVRCNRCRFLINDLCTVEAERPRCPFDWPIEKQKGVLLTAETVEVS